MILPVYFSPPPAPAPPKPKTLFDIHPLPWKLGESKTSTTDVLDATGNRVATVNSGGILLGHRDTPKMLIGLVSALRIP